MATQTLSQRDSETVKAAAPKAHATTASRPHAGAATSPIELEDVQGLVASAYRHLPHACFLALEIVDAGRAAAWLAHLAGAVTTAAGRVEGPALNVAIARSGLQKLGVQAAALDAFSLAFQEGMTGPSRRRVLGDTGESAPESWAWGAPAGASIDVLALVYAPSREQLETALAPYRALRESGLIEHRRLEATRGDREHFGFRDGISQPALEGVRTGPPRDTIKAGEVLLGYPNEYGQFTARPLLSPEEDPEHLLALDAAGSGRADLARNGSYLVLRQLEQDVAGFWSHLDAVAAGNGDADGGAVGLAARMVGRWPDGAPLVLSPEFDDPGLSLANDFTYQHRDPFGLRCPIGAHLRRAHPRDMLDPSPGSWRSLAIDKRHRLLRRGRRYGPTLERDAALAGGDGKERGLQFMCLCASLERQFEFVQHTWVNNPNFNGLYEDPDPLLGPAGRTFTMQARPARRRVTGLPAFVRTRGGGYFFLPGIRALRWLGSRA